LVFQMKVFHKTRFLGMALFDWIGTFILAYVLYFFIPYFSKMHYLTVVLITFIVGQVLHILFGVNTTFVNFLGFTFPKCKTS
jgi:hypothetical protein